MRTDQAGTTTDTAESSTESLLAQVMDQPADSAPRARVIEEVVRRHAWLTRAMASRYAQRGEDYEVLRQEASVGLMEAIQRFDPARGAFLPFAKITIRGLLRRHFRDRRRWIQIPRRLQDVQAGIRDVHDELTQTLGHEPTTSELAAHLNAPEADVAEAGAAAFRPLSLDTPTGADDDGEATLGDRLGANDMHFDQAIDLEAVRTVVTDLPLRERKILLLRFYGDLTQREIADHTNMSQMHVSRLIRDACTHLHDRILETPASSEARETSDR